MSKNIFSILLSLVTLAAQVVGLVFVWSTPGNTYYRGVEVFVTERDYVEFKLVFTDPEVLLEDAVVLASEPPIIVKFEAKVPDYDYYFPYGEMQLWGWFSKGAGGVFMFSLICVLGLVVAALPVLVMHSRFKDK